MQRKKWRDAENRVAERTAGRVQPASGARWHSKGDVKSLTQLVQVKSTDKKSFVLKLADLDELETQAARMDRDPVFYVVFGQRAYKIERDWGWRCAS